MERESFLWEKKAFKKEEQIIGKGMKPIISPRLLLGGGQGSWQMVSGCQRKGPRAASRPHNLTSLPTVFPTNLQIH